MRPKYPQFATAFIHLLSPALDALSSPCLSDSWREYVSNWPTPSSISLISPCFSPTLSLWPCSAFAPCSSSSSLLSDGVPHAWPVSALHKVRTDLSIVSEKVHSSTTIECDTTSGHHHVHREKGDEETASSCSDFGPDSTTAQFISIAILEFGVVLHSVLIGLTLAVDENFIILFIVLIFHRQSPSQHSLRPRNSPYPQKPLRVSELALVSQSSRLTRKTTGFQLQPLSCTALLPPSVSPQG